MTPEEIVQKLFPDGGEDAEGEFLRGWYPFEVRELMYRAIAAEREACAQIAKAEIIRDDPGTLAEHKASEVAEDIMLAIRARK